MKELSLSFSLMMIASAQNNESLNRLIIFTTHCLRANDFQFWLAIKFGTSQLKIPWK